MAWLGGLSGDQGGVFKPAGQFKHPQTGSQIHTSRAWTYEPATQSAIVQTVIVQIVWEENDEDGNVVNRWDMGRVRLHCAFRFEMVHLLRRVGFDNLQVLEISSETNCEMKALK
jgi:hypothetical protein